jgi:hypothetical protein
MLLLKMEVDQLLVLPSLVAWMNSSRFAGMLMRSSTLLLAIDNVQCRQVHVQVLWRGKCDNNDWGKDKRDHHGLLVQ